MMFQTSIAFAITAQSNYIDIEYTHNARFDNFARADGIDVSQWNGNIDWQKVKDDGIDYAIIRIGGRSYSQEGRLYFDDNYVANIKGAKEVGLIVGVYYFSQAVSEEEAVEEANHALELLKSENLNLPIFMDYEFAGGKSGRLEAAKLSKEEATAVAEKWCETIRNAGYQAGMYANLIFLNESIDAGQLSDNPFIWAAQYYKMCDYEGSYNMWQYTSSGKVEGISGNTDCNYWYIDKENKSNNEKDLSAAHIRIEGNGIYLYKGTRVEPEVTVNMGELTLTEGVDYLLGYINSDTTGKAYAYVSGLGEYEGYGIVEYDIVDRMPDVKIPENIIDCDEYSLDGYIRGVELGTSVDDFKKNITVAEGYTYKLTDGEKYDEKNTGNVGTGMRLRVFDNQGAEVGCQTVIIKGDCDGDGRCSVFDLVYARQVVAKMKNLSAPFIDALDVKADGKVSVFDLVVMEQNVAKLKPIEN